MNNVVNLLNMHQILVSLITGINGLGRRKGSDLSDGSDVKSVNVWGLLIFLVLLPSMSVPAFG